MVRQDGYVLNDFALFWSNTLQECAKAAVKSGKQSSKTLRNAKVNDKFQAAAAQAVHVSEGAASNSNSKSKGSGRNSAHHEAMKVSKAAQPNRHSARGMRSGADDLGQGRDDGFPQWMKTMDVATVAVAKPGDFNLDNFAGCWNNFCTKFNALSKGSNAQALQRDSNNGAKSARDANTKDRDRNEKRKVDQVACAKVEGSLNAGISSSADSNEMNSGRVDVSAAAGAHERDTSRNGQMKSNSLSNAKTNITVLPGSSNRTDPAGAGRSGKVMHSHTGLRAREMSSNCSGTRDSADYGSSNNLRHCAASASDECDYINEDRVVEHSGALVQHDLVMTPISHQMSAHGNHSNMGTLKRQWHPAKTRDDLQRFCTLTYFVASAAVSFTHLGAIAILLTSQNSAFMESTIDGTADGYGNREKSAAAAKTNAEHNRLSSSSDLVIGAGRLWRMDRPGAVTIDKEAFPVEETMAERFDEGSAVINVGVRKYSMFHKP